MNSCTEIIKSSDYKTKIGREEKEKKLEKQGPQISVATSGSPSGVKK